MQRKRVANAQAGRFIYVVQDSTEAAGEMNIRKPGSGGWVTSGKKIKKWKK